MLWAVLAIFGGAVLAPLITRVARRQAGVVLALLPAAAFVFFVQQAPSIAAGAVVKEAYPWVPAYGLSLSFYLDGLSLLFALLVTGIGTLIVLYAGGYLAGNDELGRFYVQLLAFMGAMLGLVLADDIILFFIFFELTSLTSYLLIGFYHNEESARRAARKALVVTGGGGLALMAGLLLLQQVTGAWAFSDMLSMGAAVTGDSLYTPIFVLVAIGAFTKSAQFPFHFWLPAAMAGPTPVSAYLHSATMVKAGVFVLARLLPVLGGTALWTNTLVAFGGFTMLLTAWLALRYTDLKQILAYTTTMVLGLLVLLLGVGTEAAVAAMVVFTLVHALYKGGLFMMAGNIDHETGTRDVRELGGLREEMPFTMAGGLAVALSMAGIPLLFGFVGKELVYEAALHAGALSSGLLVVAVLSNAALVASGLVVGIKPFFGREKGAFTRHPHEAPWDMWLGPVVLGALSILFGILPGLVDHALLQGAQAAILQETHAMHLALWHGITPALIASLVTFALGGALYYFWERLQASAPMAALDRFFGDGPGAVFERGLYETARLSAAATRVAQPGQFRTYLVTVFVAFILIAGGGFVAQANVTWTHTLGTIKYYELALAVLIVLSAFAAIRARERFTSILALSIGGYSVSLLWLLFGAPDLALTQFSVETLSLILLVIVLIHLPGIEEREPLSRRIRDALVATGVGAVLTTAMLAALTMPLNTRLSEYMVDMTLPRAKGHNVVNVILVDIRGFDTMGEITVLTIAALGVFVMMRMRRTPLPFAASDDDGSGSSSANASSA
ncbi:putative monovalent cation/H+ antiporter subunit A [Salisaeta longa]|uniref:putative monovalent cation/H+ antiporter subunit A n=1 Tax=Salisaeta longa TaxID=503170 RepID=UPI0003B62E42|nr:putative monovalent cation/H+ antiporter subunit A [Salisaeta longa]